MVDYTRFFLPPGKKMVRQSDSLIEGRLKMVSTSPLRILYLVDNLRQGGAQEIIFNILKTINRERYHIKVCCLGEGGIYAKRLKELGVDTVYCTSRKFNPSVLVKLLTLMRQVDVVHTHLFKANVLGLIAAKLAGKKVVVHDHSGLSDEMLEVYIRPKFLRRLYRGVFLFLLRFADRLIVISRSQVEFYSKQNIARERILLLPNGVDTDFLETFRKKKIEFKKHVRRELSIAADKYIVGMVGRFSKEKGWEYFLQAAQAVLAHRQDVVFLAVGDGQTRKESELLASNLGIGQHVHFLGQRSDVPRLLCAFDAFVLSSICETFGISILEAMYMGLPVIASDSGGPAEIILDGQNGFLVPPRDYIALADKIDFVLRNGPQGRLLSLNPSEYVARDYTIRSVTNVLCRQYDLLGA